MSKSANKKNLLLYSRGSKSIVRSLISLLALLCLFNFSFLGSTAKEREPSFRIIGSGPLQGESGIPVAVQWLGDSHLAVFDALKPAVVILNMDGTFSSAFSVRPIDQYQSSVFSFRTSPDGFIFIQALDHLFVYNQQGSLLRQLSLFDFEFYDRGNTMLLPLSQHSVLFYNSFMMQYFIGNLSNPSSLQDLSFDSTGLSFFDFTCNSSYIFILGARFNVSGASAPQIIALNHQGDFQHQIMLETDIIVSPTRISSTLDQHIIILNNNFDFASVDQKGNLYSKGSISSEVDPHLSRNFCGLSKDSFLVPNFKRGLLKFNQSHLAKVFLPVPSKDSQWLGVSALAANASHLLAFDEAQDKFFLFEREALVRSFSIQDLPKEVGRYLSLKIYAHSHWFYIAITGVRTHLFKYTPQEHQFASIEIPEYISPRSYLYVRPNDGQIFFYSWFDAILYSFNEKASTPDKIQVRRHELPMQSQQSICKVDALDNIFILLPDQNKVNVYAKEGLLLFSFKASQDDDAYMVDFDFLEDWLVMINQSKSSIDILSKRGEWINTLGKKGDLLYPPSLEGYAEHKSHFNRPVAVYCYAALIYIADSGNSRINLVSVPFLISKTIIELQIGSPSAYINGNRIALDAPPFIESGRTLVPLRFIGEAFGAEVSWLAEKRTAIIVLGNERIEVSIGNTTALINGKEHTLDVPAIIRQGRTFVPLRFIGEAFGASIVWEAESKRVIITYPGY